MYSLNETEIARLKAGIQAVFALPFVDDVEDFIWEAIFAYTKQIELIDPLNHSRSKRLFDVVSQAQGWSLKAVQWTIKPEVQFELVIQRADILKKQTALGFSDLNLDSPPSLLGQAVLHHWQDKINQDAEVQGVQDKRMAILLKSADRRHYAFYEADLAIYSADELLWQWTDESRTGLQARQIMNNRVVFRWYPNQKQLFERFSLPQDALIFDLSPRRLDLEQAIQVLLNTLAET